MTTAFLEDANLELINCEISNNQGIGTYCYWGKVELTNCEVSNNQEYGISVSDGTLYLNYCRFSYNVGRIASTSNYDDDLRINFRLYFSNIMVEV